MSLQIENNTLNKQKVAIVVVGYNRLKSLKRVINSLINAKYEETDIPLVVSIDCSGNKSVYEYVNSIVWPYGKLYVNIQSERLGLKKHILQCGDLTKFFRAIILLEDDIYVSDDYYNYTIAALNKYEYETKVAGIALYSSEYIGNVNLPFQPLNNGTDCYAYQTVCSWGQCWNSRMWGDFRAWLDKWDENFDHLEMPARIKTWTKAWSKYFFAYEIINDLYFIVPYVSLATCFNDIGGEHGGGYSANQQVSLQIGRRNYRFDDFEKLIKYNVFGQNLLIYEKLNLNRDELCIDLYGASYDGEAKKKYLLTICKYPYKVIRTYGLQLRPIELNVIKEIEGDDIILYDMSIKDSGKKEIYPIKALEYFVKNFNSRFLVRYSFYLLKSAIVNRIKMILRK